MVQTGSKELGGRGEVRNDPASSLVSHMMMLVACSWEFTAAIHCIDGVATHLFSEPTNACTLSLVANLLATTPLVALPRHVASENDS